MRGAGHIVIAGAGVSGCLLAIALRARGMEVTLVDRPSGSRVDVVEAIPERPLHLFAELGLMDVLKRAGAVPVRGFHNAWDERAPSLVDGWFLHVERKALATALRAEVLARGGGLRIGRAHLLVADRAGVRVDIAGELLVGDVAVDATGRTALWERPVRRASPFTAHLFDGPGAAAPEPGRVVRLGEAFAYRLDHPRRCTVAVVHPSAAAPPHVRDVAGALAVDDAHLLSCGQRVASVQWSPEPIGGRCLAVGDAALAYDPVAGQGIRFAVHCAFAAAAVLDTWRQTSDFADPVPSVAVGYYRDFIDGARARHERALAELREEPSPESTAQDDLTPDDLVKFCGRECHVGIIEGGLVVERKAWALADGGLVRFLGAFDLAHLRGLAATPRRIAELRFELCTLGLHDADALAVLRFCFVRGLLTRVREEE